MTIRALYEEEAYDEYDQALYQTEPGFTVGYLFVYDDQGSEESHQFCLAHRNDLKDATRIDREGFPLPTLGGAVVQRKIRNRLQVSRGERPAALMFPRPQVDTSSVIQSYVEGLGVEWVAK